MNSDVTIAEGLKSALAKCKPGQTKTIEVTVSMDKDGKATLNADKSYGEEAAEAKPAAAAVAVKKKSSRPKPVMDAIASMY